MNDTTPQPTLSAAKSPVTDEPEADLAPPEAEEHELRCTLCGLRACWTG